MGIYTLLSKIHSPEDIKHFSQKELKALAVEIRRTIIEVVGKNGGHLASNLGVVELTIALHRVFNSPEDAIVWDVSHQCYAHKLITGRYAEFATLRQADGLSGFTKKAESPHDFFDNGHSSTSISSALGLITAWNIQEKGGHVIAVIGDGALTGGMAFEALSNAGQLAKNLIVIVNDNQMSIDQNTGALSSYLSRLTMTTHYQFFRHCIDKFVKHIPFFGSFLTKFIFRFKRGLKGLLFSNNLFSDFGFEYVGPLDGHDEKGLENVLNMVKDMNRPVVVHVVTKKGKGYSPAEDHPERFHGIGPFCISDGTVEKFDTLSFTESFSSSLMKLAEERSDIVCITAAMAKGTGLAVFARHYPQRFFDVGIAEEHAVTFGGGLARGGLLPVICIYSTFMQRAVDQLIHDISLQKLHAVIVLDRAGAVPNDGETHQGVFDIALFRPVPGITIMSPATAVDLDICLRYAVNAEGAVVIRYPKMSCPSEQPSFSLPAETGRGILVKASEFCPSLEVSLEDDAAVKNVLFVTTGGMFSEVTVASRSLLMKNIIADIYTLRFIKPFDSEYFLEIAHRYDGIVFVEDGVVTGGIAEFLAGLCAENEISCCAVKAFPDSFFSQGSRSQICEQAGMSPADLQKAAEDILKR
ncbi:1-deoxy-D-xylulose-5-phosphate synthase [Treponema porcinum]|uniref:1-deoxy-D-xylulose-5-phosphate synthase n=1 Tax=Treponema porcinum TaxID=261392 RepID=UPI002409A41A|nr:1-deoxy-D-xylulose-5-phosphate synthase [Treponema porcinum]MDD6900180.1 1-deoxy-D-xylulose-5-phosphate synthase [Treponema porcinum]